MSIFKLTILPLFVIACTLMSTANAQTLIQFDLQGQGGSGLLPENETPALSGAGNGTGGEIGSGVTYDPATMVLSLNFGWGTVNGFEDLSGPATAAHLHGATDGSQTTASGVLQGFNFVDNAADSGSVNFSFTLTQLQEDIVLNGQSYINVHTSANTNGEIRGNLIPIASVPEPSSLALLALTAMTGFVRRRR